MEYIKELHLDVSGGESYACVTAKQFDKKARYIKIILYDNSKKYVFPDDAEVKLRARKPDGNSVLNDADVDSDKSIIVELTEQLLAVAGNVKAELSLYGSDGAVLTSCTFYIIVVPTVCDFTKIESTYEYNSLNSALQSVSSAVDSAQSASKNAADIAQALVKAKENGEFNGAQGPQGEKGEKGEQGSPGTTDYWKLENMPFKPLSCTKADGKRVNITQDLDNGKYIFIDEGGIELYTSAGEYVDKGDIVCISSYYKGGSASGKQAMLIQDSDVTFVKDDGSMNMTAANAIETIPYLSQYIELLASPWQPMIGTAKVGQLVSVKGFTEQGLPQLEGVAVENDTECKSITDNIICIDDNTNNNINSISCDSYPKQITIIRNNMITCDDFYSSMGSNNQKIAFTNHLNAFLKSAYVNFVYFNDGMKQGSYILSAKCDTEGTAVNKTIRTMTGEYFVPNSTADVYEFNLTKNYDTQVQVRLTSTAANVNVSQLYMCRAEDKQTITVNSADELFENILGSRNTYIFAEDNSPITVNYNVKKQDKLLKGKYLSVIGDSISSYEGYSKRTDHIVYPSYDVFKPERTYWGRFCKITGAEPLVIDGVGSSTVTDNRDGLNGDETFLGMYHDNRALQLGTDSHTPDIIIVEGGTNDMALNIALGTYDGSADISEITNLNWFREAYAVMLDKIRTAYPKAEIYCCTIMARGGTSDYKIKQYNEAIKDIAELMGAKITDTAKCINMKNRNSFLSSDGIHPTYQGHIRMCDELLKAVI